MAVPRNRLSNARKNARRSHHAKKPKNVGECSNCGQTRMPHRVCLSCGHYGNKLVLSVKESNAS